MLVTFSDTVTMGNMIEQYSQVIGSFHPTGPLLTIKICRRTEKDSSISGQSSLFLPLLLLSSRHSSSESRCGRQARYSPYYIHSYLGIHFKESFQSLDAFYSNPLLIGIHFIDTPITGIQCIETLQSLGYTL